MPILVYSQAYVFCWSAAGGMIIAFLFDLFRIKRKTVRTPAVIVFIEDLLFWIIATFITFLTSYYFNSGELRSYIFFGAAAGIIIYSLLFSKAVMISLLAILKTLARMVVLIAKLLSYPISFFSKAFILTALIIKKIIQKYLKQKGKA